MKNTIKTIFALAFCLMLGIAANAQVIVSGTVDFSVTVLPSFDLRSGGPATGSPGMVAFNLPANATLGATLTVADASPNFSNVALTAIVPLRLRSNAPYKLTASRSGGVDPNPAINFDGNDIAMTVNFPTRVGAGADVNAGGSDTAIVVGNGTVGALTGSPVSIANGTRISNGGNTVSTDNYITPTLNFSAPRAFYTPGVYTDQITIGIFAQP